MIAPMIQHPPDHVELDGTVGGARYELCRQLRSALSRCKPVKNASQELGSESVIHSAAIIGIDQRQVPQFTTLIDIRHAGRSELQESLCQRVNHSDPRDMALKR